MPVSGRSDAHELRTATEALTTLLADIETTADRAADIDALARTVPCCVEAAGLLSALAGRLGALATALVDMSHDRRVHRAAEETMAEVAADLTTMRGLLHRVTAVATPAITDLRHVPAR